MSKRFLVPVLAAIITFGVSSSVLAKEYPISVLVDRPAEFTIPNVKKVAVTPFVGQSGASITNLLSSRLFEGKIYQLLDRAQIERIMQEHGLAIEKGIVDASDAKEIGKFMAVDALIFGSVDNAAVQDRDEVTELSKDGENNTTVVVKAPTTVREGRLSVTFKMVNVQSGEIIALKNVQKSWSGKHINDPYPNISCTGCYLFKDNPMKQSVDLPVKESLIEKLMDQAAIDFANSISPHKEQMTLVWDDDHGEKQPGEEVVNLVNAGMVPDAAQRMAQLLKDLEQNPKKNGDARKVAAAYYDCGLISEIQGDYEKAADWYKRAVTKNISKPNKLHLESKRRSEELIGAQMKLQEQQSR